MPLSLETKCVHLKRTETDGCSHYGSVSFPIYQTATYAHPGVGESTGFDYSRLQNPTRDQLEKVVCQLESGIDAFAMASGMAAVSLVMEMFVPGDHIIVDSDLYGGSIRLFDHVSAKNGISFTRVNTSAASLSELEQLVTPQTKAVYIETPTNPMMNITDIAQTPLHIAFEEVCRAAAARGLRVTGAEIVGLVPKSALIDAGKFYLARQQRSLGIPEEEIIRIAIKSMGLDELKPFNPKEKVIEYMMVDEAEQAEKEHLIRMTCKGFALETASESAAPGGGSISAYMGALGAALGTMVANLSAHKRGWDDRWEEFSRVAEEGQQVMNELLALVDEDTAAFNKIMAVFAMPKTTPEEKAARAEAMEAATLYATQVPLRTMQTAIRAFPVLKAMAEKGNPASASDAGVGALAARAAVRGADMNVRINAAGLKNRDRAEALIAQAAELVRQAETAENEVLALVNANINR